MRGCAGWWTSKRAACAGTVSRLLHALRLLLSLTLLATAAHAVTLTRGPFLQLADSTGVTVVFHTDLPSIGAVRFGASPGPLSGQVTELVPESVHAVRLSGLTPSTRYAYEVSVDGVTVAGGDSFRFRTYPPPGSPESFRLFAWGDSGVGTNEQLRLADQLSAEAGDATLSLILGDIVYYLGEPALYDARYFEPYAALLRRMVVWPTIGNHDVGLDPLGGPYLDAFHLPTNNPAGTELYYSFDYGDAHFVCLDTHVSGHAAGSAQLQWAAADLAATSAKWKVVFFHVPPYSGGSHLDDPGVRDGILPVLEAAGVDVVFSGHSHVYERTYLLRSNAIVQNDRSHYVKNIPGAGTLYVVSGTAGQTGPLANPSHPLMAFQAGNVIGASVVDVSGNTLHGYFLQQDGTAVDLFRLEKGLDITAPRILGVRARSDVQVDVSFDEPVFAGTGAGGAERASAWEIVPPVAVLSAQLMSDARTVRLTTAAHRPGRYELRGVGVGDRSGGGNLSATRVMYEVPRWLPLTNAAIRYAAADAGVSPGWRESGFDDSAWRVGTLPIGYGEPGLATNVAPTTTLYGRLHFSLPAERALLRELTLDLDYDDGFVASLNGVEVLRQNVPAAQTPATLASASREAGLVQRFTLAPPAAAILRDTDDNVLAIEVHNVTASSSDLLLSARLSVQVGEGLDAGSSSDGGIASDAGGSDAGGSEAGGPDAGERDAGPSDAGFDAGPTDVGVFDAGVPNAGDAPGLYGGGCACGQFEGAPALLLLAIVALRVGRARNRAR